MSSSHISSWVPGARLTWWAGVLVLTLGVSSWAEPVGGQAVGTILGRVWDRDTGDPIEGATVRLLGENLQVLTGSEGWYALTGVPVGIHQVAVTRIGFELRMDSVRVTSGDALEMDFVLAPEAVPLEEILVSATPEGRGDVGQRTIIMREELEKRQAGTVTELLRSLVPGMSLTGAGGQVGASASIRMRGVRSMQEQHPLIFVDGIRVGSARMVGPPGTESILDFLDNIDPADIERIEVIRNPEAALLYGTDAGGGVILIFTRRSRVP